MFWERAYTRRFCMLEIGRSKFCGYTKIIDDGVRTWYCNASKIFLRKVLIDWQKRCDFTLITTCCKIVVKYLDLIDLDKYGQ